MSEIDLLADVSLGTASFRVTEKRYELSLRTIRILLDTENATMSPGTAYTLVLQEGAFEISEAEKQIGTRASSAKAGGKARLSAKLVGWLPVISAQADTEVTGSIEGGRTTELRSERRAVRLVELVRTDGQNAWVAGEPDGDPRRPQTKDLRGDVVSARDGDALKPLCVLVATDPTKPVSGRVSVNIKDTGFALSETGPEAAMRELLFESLKADEHRTLARRLRAERALRNRVAALAMARHGGQRGMEVCLASRAFGFEPDLDDVAPHD